jgi:hypothetical protein
MRKNVLKVKGERVGGRRENGEREGGDRVGSGRLDGDMRLSKSRRGCM